ncbi:heme-binding domain-containing protein [Maribacter sp. 2304DJ31-5]|uniref:heme-binding domain-containing protein n=1 Tax=Maribacter sp. 2304DJ31-5 TaxID=3386273 RepID=UPI0039BC2E3E
MKILKKILLVLLILGIAIQFYRPEKNLAQGEHTLPFLTETNPPNEVRTLLKTACYDCHSNHTNYPWYNNIAPISFWLQDHIKEGKEELNFSDWAQYSNKRKDHKLEELIEEVSENEMPLAEYTWTHKEAVLDREQIDAIVRWAKKTRVLYQLGKQPN